jgi:carbon-monoxide dehydrogenase medium subunit
MRHFDYEKVDSLKEAFDAISASRGGSVFMAGGTDLLVQIKEGKIKPQRVIDVKGIHEMDGLSVPGEALSIGSLTTIRTLETSPVTSEKTALLADAAARLGSVQVRNRATIGGNLCNASPSAEMAPALLVLDAQAEIYGKTGMRTVDMGEFFLGPGVTNLGEGEILTDPSTTGSLQETRWISLSSAWRFYSDWMEMKKLPRHGLLLAPWLLPPCGCLLLRNSWKAMC